MSFLQFCYENFRKIPGLSPIETQGAMFMMVSSTLHTSLLLLGSPRFSAQVKIEIDWFDETIQDCVSFTQNLVMQQSVSVLPGISFRAPNYFRIVLCPPIDILWIAINRIREFCMNHLENPRKHRRFV